MNFCTEQLSLSVIIPVYNGGEKFQRCLASLAIADPPPQEVIVVSDGSTDDSVAIAQAYDVSVIEVPHSQGPAKARNLGAKEAKGTVLFFLDADVEVHPPIFGQAIATLAHYREVDALIGSYDDDPGARNFLSQYKNLLHHYTHQQAREEASTFWGACGVVRRDVFQALGGFDERYRRPCVEDIELGYRLRQAGHQIRLCKTLQVKHLKRWGIVSLLQADFFYRALPWTALILRHRQLNNDLNTNWSSRLSILCVYGLVGSLGVSYWLPWLLIVSIGLSLILLMLNWPVYHFFYEKRGLYFTVKSLFWHWLYYFYSGLAVVIGLLRYVFFVMTSQKS